MLKTIYLLRHGETEWNKEWRFQGQKDVNLSTRGLEQAERAANKIKEIELDSIYSSDLVRAKKTAIVAAHNHNLNIQESINLREISFGDWEGLAYKDFSGEEREHFNRWLEDPVNYPVPGGETLSQLQGRVESFLVDIIISSEENSNTLIVTHGGPIKAVISRALKTDIRNFASLVISPASLSIIQVYEKSFYLTLLNDVCHLDDK